MASQGRLGLHVQETLSEDFFEAALRQPNKTRVVSVKVEVGEEESIQAALLRLRVKASRAYRRQWSKTRFGAYEKPSYLKRKSESTRKRNARLAQYWLRPGARATVYLGLGYLMDRDEVYQRKRLPFKPHRRWWGDDD